MKQSRRCPKCAHRGIAVCPLRTSRGGSAAFVTLSPGDPAAPLRPPGMDLPGLLEAHVCTRCGFAELYVRDAHRLQPVVRG